MVFSAWMIIGFINKMNELKSMPGSAGKDQVPSLSHTRHSPQAPCPLEIPSP